MTSWPHYSKELTGSSQKTAQLDNGPPKLLGLQAKGEGAEGRDGNLASSRERRPESEWSLWSDSTIAGLALGGATGEQHL